MPRSIHRSMVQSSAAPRYDQTGNTTPMGASIVFGRSALVRSNLPMFCFEQRGVWQLKRLKVSLAALSLLFTFPALADHDSPSVSNIAAYLDAHPDFFVRHPDILEAALNTSTTRATVEANDARAYILHSHAALLTSKESPTRGGDGASNTIVEFYDYQCPPCRASESEMLRLMAHRKDVRVITLPLPIFGPASVLAARVGVVAHRHGVFATYHERLMALPGTLTRSAIEHAAVSTGVPAGELWRQAGGYNVSRYLSAVKDLAGQLGVTGLPTFIVNGVLIKGGIAGSTLEDAIAASKPPALSVGDPTSLASDALEIGDGEVHAFLAKKPEFLIDHADLLRLGLQRIALQERDNEARLRLDRIRRVIGTNLRVPHCGNASPERLVVAFLDDSGIYSSAGSAVLIDLVKEDPTIGLWMLPVSAGSPRSEWTASVILGAARAVPASSPCLRWPSESIGRAAVLSSVAGEAGLDVDALAQATTMPETVAQVRDDRAIAESFGITRLPSYLICGKLIEGLLTRKAAIDALSTCSGR